MTSVLMPSAWVAPPNPGLLLALVMLGVFGSLGHLLLIRAYDRATASALAPLAYLELLWVTVVGFVVFSELPNVLALAGIGLIAAAGIVAARRERSASPAEAEAKVSLAR